MSLLGRPSLETHKGRTGHAAKVQSHGPDHFSFIFSMTSLHVKKKGLARETIVKVLLALHQSAPACAHAHALIPKYS